MFSNTVTIVIQIIGNTERHVFVRYDGKLFGLPPDNKPLGILMLDEEALLLVPPLPRRCGFLQLLQW